ncbi:MAG: DinB family protein [Anaerolineae bacterium]
MPLPIEYLSSIQESKGKRSMDSVVKTAVWQQFGAAIDFLADTVRLCPDDLWRAPLWLTPNVQPELAQFWYVTYHTLFWLDLYLTGAEEGFLPPPPFTLIEQDENGPLPERVYTKDELLAYLEEVRRNCKATIDGLTDETAERVCRFGWGQCSFLELLMYNMRHVHGHASQLNMLLGQKIGPVPSWVGRPRKG